MIGPTNNAMHEIYHLYIPGRYPCAKQGCPFVNTKSSDHIRIVGMNAAPIPTRRISNALKSAGDMTLRGRISCRSIECMRKGRPYRIIELVVRQ